MTHILDIRDVEVDYAKRDEQIRALDGVTLSVQAGEVVGLVGESGSGKSTVGQIVGRMLPSNARITRGSVRVSGEDVLTMPTPRVRELRRRVLGFIPQDPVTALDPTMRIGRQLRLALRDTPRVDLEALLERVRISDPRRVLRMFPHQISGGMAQRVVIAATMARGPRLLVADEPTAALDSSVRQSVTSLLFELAGESGATVLWMSHDLRSVGRWCDRVAVMFHGRVVEDGPASAVLAEPSHPYTIALAAADPINARPGERLEVDLVDRGLAKTGTVRVTSDTALEGVS